MKKLSIAGVCVLAFSAALIAQRRGGPPPVQTPPPGTPQAPSVFRAGTVLVPIDVRVVDRLGNPVTDLRQDEFVITENNVRQQIQHFSTQSLTATTPTATSPSIQLATLTSEIAAPKQRTFLIVLGRGRLQKVTQALDGMMHFVRERLLPQDYVAVLAYNRATDFTTDHEKVALVLDRFNKSGDKIESLMAQQHSGLAASYGSNAAVPKEAQALIDQVFAGPSARTVTDATNPSGTRMAGDQRTAADAIMTSDIASQSNGVSLTNRSTNASGVDMTFDDYVEATAQSNQDVSKIYSGISYLRYFEGEKHLVFISERGLFLPRSEDDRSIAALAADARVVIDIMHTGGTGAPVVSVGQAGIPNRMQPGEAMVTRAGAGAGASGGRYGTAAPPELTKGATGENGVGRGRGFIPAVGDWRISSSQTVTQQTGGFFSSTMKGKVYADQLDATTRFSYLLGYYPANGNLDGRFRNIRVLVTRRGPGVGPLTVEARRGYFANNQITPLDKTRVLTYSRVVSAANMTEPVPDIAMTATATNELLTDGSAAVDIKVQIRPERIGLVDKDGKKKGGFDVAIFCADDKERLLGESWEHIDLEMTPEALARFQTTGPVYAGKIAVRAPARFVKVIVYDLTSDLLGSQTLKLELPKVKK